MSNAPIGRGILAVIVGIVWPNVTILALVIVVAFGVVLAVRPDVGAVTLALLFGLYSLIFGVSEIMVGYELRHSGGSLRPVMQKPA